MPLRDYQCVDCGQIEERLVPHAVHHAVSAFHTEPAHAEPIERQCIACHGEMRVVTFSTPASFHFKGTGWAKDGYSSP